MHRLQNKSPYFYILIAVVLTAILYIVVNWLTQPRQLESSISPSGVSMTQLLSVPEVTEKALFSVVEDNPEILLEVQTELVATAEKLGFSDSQLSFLASEPLLDYLRYHAKREMFNAAVNQAYINLERIDDIKAQYPEARDLFKDAEQLIIRRNQLIEQIALSLANQEGLSVPTKAHFQEAATLWRQKMAHSN